ncbi:hypothetical protein B484DRAFT_465931, partial [Ochromonadaceae sp. CCMP2298]
ILCSVDDLSLYHYYGFELELQRIFPHYLLHNRLEQEQMVITLWFLRQRDSEEVDIMVWVCMLHRGGCAPHPILSSVELLGLSTLLSTAMPLLQGQLHEEVLIAPRDALLEMVEKSTSPVPLFLLRTLGGSHTLDGYEKWVDTQDLLSKEQLGEHITLTRMWFASSEVTDIALNFVKEIAKGNTARAKRYSKGMAERDRAATIAFKHLDGRLPLPESDIQASLVAVPVAKGSLGRASAAAIAAGAPGEHSHSFRQQTRERFLEVVAPTKAKAKGALGRASASALASISKGGVAVKVEAISAACPEKQDKESRGDGYSDTDDSNNSEDSGDSGGPAGAGVELDESAVFGVLGDSEADTERELESLLQSALSEGKEDKREASILRREARAEKVRSELLNVTIKSTLKALDALAVAISKMDTDRKQIDSRHDETVRLLREEITNRQEKEVKERHLTFRAGSTYVARGAEPVTKEVWEVSTGTIEVDPRDPPAYLHRFYGVAGWPPPLPDQDPIEAPHGEFSMMDSYRTTGGDLREKLIDSSHPLHELRKRFIFHEFPGNTDAGTRILLMQASDMLWEDLSQPLLTLDKISMSCLCSYVVTRTTDDPHGFLYLESPIVIQGPADVVWRDTMRIPVPSVFLPYLIILAPGTSTGAGSKKRDYANTHGDRDSSDRDDGNDRHRDKRGRRDRDRRDHGAGEVYGPWWGEVYRDAYQQICNMIARGRCGRDNPFHYLEATANDALYYVYDAARNPGVTVTLPGQTRPCLPADLRPAQWARALVCAFETLVASYKKLDKFSNYTFYTKHQPRPPATFKRKKPVIKPTPVKVKPTPEKPNPNTPPGPGEGKRAKVERKGAAAAHQWFTRQPVPGGVRKRLIRTLQGTF